MNIYEHVINNIDKYYDLIPNNMFDNIHKNNINLLDNISNIILYGNKFYGSMYSYYLLNKHLNKTFNTSLYKYETKMLKINNSNVEFNYYQSEHIIKLDFSSYYNNSNHIISKFLLPIIQNKRIDNNKHIILIENFNNLITQSFSILRVMLEKYKDNCIFIFIACSSHNIPDYIKSRCLMIRCPIINNNNLLNNFVENILKDYKIIYEDLIDTFFVSKLKNICANIDNENNFHTDDEIYNIEFKFYNELKDDLLIKNNFLKNIDSDNIYRLNYYNPFKILSIIDLKIQELLISILKIKVKNIKLDNNNQDEIQELFNNLKITNNKNNIFDDKNELDYIIKNHINYIKKNKNIYNIIKKNKTIIYKLNNLCENSKIILENYLKYIIKNTRKHNHSKIINLTSKTEYILKDNIINNHYLEYYFLELHKLLSK